MLHRRGNGHACSCWKLRFTILGDVTAVYWPRSLRGWYSRVIFRNNNDLVREAVLWLLEVLPHLLLFPRESATVRTMDLVWSTPLQNYTPEKDRDRCKEERRYRLATETENWLREAVKREWGGGGGGGDKTVPRENRASPPWVKRLISLITRQICEIQLASPRHHQQPTLTRTRSQFHLPLYHLLLVFYQRFYESTFSLLTPQSLSTQRY